MDTPKEYLSKEKHLEDLVKEKKMTPRRLWWRRLQKFFYQRNVFPAQYHTTPWDVMNGHGNFSFSGGYIFGSKFADRFYTTLNNGSIIHRIPATYFPWQPNFQGNLPISKDKVILDSNYSSFAIRVINFSPKNCISHIHST